jgi:queuine tRNA-ribosyltransferase
MTFKFEITHTDPHSKARLGLYTTPHGTIETPNFIFCGTKASIKGVSAQQMREAKADIILANTYHLMLSPGADVIEKMGGLHQFMGWHGPMFTDSGGFQIFSLGHGAVNDEIKGRGHNRRSKSAVKMSEVGAEFRSHIDGRKFMLSPEESIQTQRKLGADLIVQMTNARPFTLIKTIPRVRWK